MCFACSVGQITAFLISRRPFAVTTNLVVLSVIDGQPTVFCAVNKLVNVEAGEI